jgi:hypothetical protein
MNRLTLILLTLCIGCAAQPPQLETSEATAAKSQLTLPAFPLRVSANHRYLEDSTGKPFRVQSESAWMMSIKATASDVDRYLADRQTKGFNTFVLMAIVPAYFGGPNNRAGAAPFTKTNDFSTPNEAYWQFIDTIIDKAAAKGMLVQLAYVYLGYQGAEQGWWREINEPQNTQTVMYNYGVWLGRRYATRKNVFWYTCGDYAPPTGSEGSKRVHKTVEGIKSVIPNALFGAEMNLPDSLPSEVSDFKSVIDVNTFYGYGPNNNGQTYETGERAWRAGIPGWIGEPNYEATAFGDGSRDGVRKAQWWSVIAGGSAGHNFGTAEVWNFNVPTMWSHMSSPATVDQTRIFTLFSTFNWWQMVPSGTEAGFAGKDLITSGVGTDGSLIVSSVTSNGSALLAYVPPTGTGARTFSVNMAALSGTASARWFNPITGGWTSAGSSLANSGSRSFTTPGNNGAANDWALLIETGTGSGGTSGSGGSAGSAGAASAGTSGAAGMAGGAAGAGGASGRGGWAGSSGAGVTSDSTGTGATGATCATGGTTTAGSGSGGTGSGTLKLGESNLLPIDDSGNGDLLVAMRAALARNGTMTSLRFYATTANEKLRLGLYDSSGSSGGPGRLLVQSNELTTTVGWNVASITPRSLQAGNYWLVYAPKTSNLHFKMDTTGTARWYSKTYGSMPSKFSTSTQSGTYHWSFYATFQ